MGAQSLGVESIIFKDLVKESEEILTGVEEFPAVFLCDHAQIVDDPANGFKFPFTGKADETVIGGDVGEKGEGAATEGTIVPLASVGTKTGKGDHAGREV